MEELEDLVRRVSKDITKVNDLICFCLSHSLYRLGALIGREYQTSLRPETYEAYAVCLFYAGEVRESHRLNHWILTHQTLNEDDTQHFLFNLHFGIPQVKDDYIAYPPELVARLILASAEQMPKSRFWPIHGPKLISSPSESTVHDPLQWPHTPVYTFSITTCKRLDLMKKTINSFLRCCQDHPLFDRWICIDDNSSPEDRAEMERLYPFFEFVWKTPEERGHPQSMNLLLKKVRERGTIYLFHMEDDWQFFSPGPYLRWCTEILNSDPSLGQALINLNYAETEKDHELCGGWWRSTSSGLTYVLHRYCGTESELKQFQSQYPGGKHCSYWPHYSLRPSLLRFDVMEKVGEFSLTSPHFEMDYSYRYVAQGFRSAFLSVIASYHIGRLTSERFDHTRPNAYELNRTAQFTGEHQSLRGYVLNLDRRSDRWETFQQENGSVQHELGLTRFSAVDGKEVTYTHQLGRIFDVNDYHWRRGIIGCALSHFRMWLSFLGEKEDLLLVLEDDVTLTSNFVAKLHSLLARYRDKFELLFLGHFYYQHSERPEAYNREVEPDAEQWTLNRAVSESMGGTIGYVVTRKGVEELLSLIDQTGMPNAIDWMMRRGCDRMRVYYAFPHLVFSECYREDRHPDSDIQYSYDGVSVTTELRLQEEEIFYRSLGLPVKRVRGEDLVLPIETVTLVEGKTEENILQPFYRLGEEAMVIVPLEQMTDEVRAGRCFSRLKRYDPQKRTEVWSAP